MPFPIEKKLVIAVSATALFDLEDEHKLYLEHGIDKFRAYQREHRNVTPARGAAFPFIQRLLHLNEAYPAEKPVEVVILSRHHADAGLRIMDAVRSYGLDISRSFFLAGTLPFPYMKAINSVLYLSTNKDEVRTAVEQGFPAGQVLPCKTLPADDDKQLRIAFDFDGVLVDDEAEKVYSASNNLHLFLKHEDDNRDKPLHSGPLMPLLQRISQFQKLERQKAQHDTGYTQMLRIAIVTARNAPAHERLVNTLSSLEIETDELFLMGGIEKKLVLDILKPHIFFDDQLGHLTPACDSTPSVHIPFGVANPSLAQVPVPKRPIRRAPTPAAPEPVVMPFPSKKQETQVLPEKDVSNF
jgi:5'-nucleotidase